MSPTTIFAHGLLYIYEVRAEAGGPVVQVTQNVDRYAPNLTARCRYFFDLIAGHYHRDAETVAGLVNDAHIMTSVTAAARARAYAPNEPSNDMLARSLAASLPTADVRARHIGASPLRLHSFVTHCLGNMPSAEMTSTSIFNTQTGIFVYHEFARLLAALSIAAQSGEVMLLNGKGRAKPAEVINEHELRAKRAEVSPTF